MVGVTKSLMVDDKIVDGRDNRSLIVGVSGADG
jgi:hypothetical protein